MSQAEQAALKVDVLPLEAQKLAFPHASVDGQHVEGFKTIAACRFDQGLYLLPIQGGNLLAFDLRGLDSFAYVAGDQPVEHRLLERLAQYAVHLAHRGRGEAGVQLLTVEASHMDGAEVFELDATEGRDYVRFDHVPVNLIGTDAHLTPHRILQPACEIFPNRDAPRVEDRALSAATQGLDELVVYFVARLVRHVAALGTFCRLDPVSTPVSDLLAVLLVGIYRALAVTLFRHHSPFISSRGSTPNASASLWIVEAWAGRCPSSSLLIVS